jgi:hypothetical protein
MKRGTKAMQPLGKTSAQAAVLARVGFLSVLLVALCAGSPTSIAQTRTYDSSIGGTGSKSGEGNGIGGTGEPAAKAPGIGGTGGGGPQPKPLVLVEPGSLELSVM